MGDGFRHLVPEESTQGCYLDDHLPKRAGRRGSPAEEVPQRLLELVVIKPEPSTVTAEVAG